MPAASEYIARPKLQFMCWRRSHRHAGEAGIGPMHIAAMVLICAGVVVLAMA